MCPHCAYLGYPCPRCERDAEDRADRAQEPSDDLRELDMNHARGFGAQLSRGGW